MEETEFHILLNQGRSTLIKLDFIVFFAVAIVALKPNNSMMSGRYS